MSDNEYRTVFERLLLTQQKFEYFVLGATLAVLGFSITLFPDYANGWIAAIHILAIVSLGISLVAGFRRQEAVIAIRQQDYYIIGERKDPKLLEKDAEKWQSIAGLSYDVQKWALASGLIFLSSAYIIQKILTFLLATP